MRTLAIITLSVLLCAATPYVIAVKKKAHSKESWSSKHRGDQPYMETKTLDVPNTDYYLLQVVLDDMEYAALTVSMAKEDSVVLYKDRKPVKEFTEPFRVWVTSKPK